jgi:isoleucyl-tRNA synthetase
MNEVNVKELEFLRDTSGILVKKIKPNFKTLGPRYGKLMKDIAQVLSKFSQEDISCIECADNYEIIAGGEKVILTPADVEITSEDIPGWLVSTEGRLTVALDVNISQELRDEGIAREFVNRIQNLRKDSGFEVTDKIAIEIRKHELINGAVNIFKDYIANQTLAKSVELVEMPNSEGALEVEIDENIFTLIKVSKI